MKKEIFMEKLKIVLYARGKRLNPTNGIIGWAQQLYFLYKSLSPIFEITAFYVDEIKKSNDNCGFNKMLEDIKKLGNICSVYSFSDEVLKDGKNDVSRIINSGVSFIVLAASRELAKY